MPRSPEQAARTPTPLNITHTVTEKDTTRRAMWGGGASTPSPHQGAATMRWTHNGAGGRHFLYRGDTYRRPTAANLFRRENITLTRHSKQIIHDATNPPLPPLTHHNI